MVNSMPTTTVPDRALEALGEALLGRLTSGDQQWESFRTKYQDPQELERLLSLLDNEEARDIVHRSFGLDGYVCHERKSQIAESLGCPVHHVRNILARALRQLRNELRANEMSSSPAN